MIWQATGFGERPFPGAVWPLTELTRRTLRQGGSSQPPPRLAGCPGPGTAFVRAVGAAWAPQSAVQGGDTARGPAAGGAGERQSAERRVPGPRTPQGAASSPSSTRTLPLPPPRPRRDPRPGGHLAPWGGGSPKAAQLSQLRAGALLGQRRGDGGPNPHASSLTAVRPGPARLCEVAGRVALSFLKTLKRTLPLPRALARA